MGEKIFDPAEFHSESSSGSRTLYYFADHAFDSILKLNIPIGEKCKLFSDFARLNALYMIYRAGSGHIGSSFSSIDIVTCLYLGILRDGDRYFSSKGHDSPGLYAVQAALGIFPFDMIHKLRRLNGLPGHPDVRIDGTYTNTGSLGMGVSKAKGFLYADSLKGNTTSRVFVLTGDGELQEGQLWESLLSVGRTEGARLTVIVDHNKIQSDTYIDNVSCLGDLQEKFVAFGWEVKRCSGHDHSELLKALEQRTDDGRPMVVIADTIKGKGVSFMEHTSMGDGEAYYKYHSGAPSGEEYCLAVEEILNGIEKQVSDLKAELPPPKKIHVADILNQKVLARMIPEYTRVLLNEARNNRNIVALDADLVLDTGLIPFKEEFPSRFIECGIAEQDMVSQAGTIALCGFLPVVHSFACFLTSRASEQIYNNCTQESKVIYVGSLAGLLPGGPGHSHQAVRDVTAMMAMPNMAIVEPVVPSQLEGLISWAFSQNHGSTYLRITSVPFQKDSRLESTGDQREGRGELVCDGEDVLIIAFGPIMSIEALGAVDILADLGVSAALVSTPWLNRIDLDWAQEVVSKVRHIVTVENHYMEGGAGSWYITKLSTHGKLRDKTTQCIGLQGIPVCGNNDEVLDYHGLTSEKLAKSIYENIAIS